MKRALSSLRSKRFRVVSEQRKTEERQGTGFSVFAARRMEREPNNAGGRGGGEWKIRSLKEVEQEVIITNNNLPLHNNDRVVLTMERCVESDNALAPKPS